MATECSIEVRVNGEVYRRTIEARKRLGDFLREDLELTGTHLACEHGVCGVCTVLIDGRPALACLTLAVQADGRSIETVEGLSHRDALSDLQAAFREKHALQCGYCTPGFLMALTGLFKRNPNPTDAEIKEVIDGIVCRCTGYVPIFDAAAILRDRHNGRRA
jgi:2-furoyl-CoA dehydrogenase 2Fe-2S iron sulfur subunit